MIINYTTDINKIDSKRALILIDASLQAYRVFEGKTPIAPEGYEYVETWKGIDSLFGKKKTVETYGVVFRSTKLKTGPASYIFAFRGTDSLLDGLDDAGIEHKPFTPFNKDATVKDGIEVEAGFFDVYSESDGATQSMQQQLFSLIDKYQASNQPISELLVTGHSLGSALSELFTLDLALSRPAIKALNYNYACPRVGNRAFVDFYQSQPAQQDAATRTLRFQNTHDKVPCVPLNSMHYYHLENAFLVAFYKHGWFGKLEELDLLKCHSALAYKAVLNCAANSKDGICTKKKLPVHNPDDKGKSFEVDSEVPDCKNVCTFWPFEKNRE